MNRRLAAGAFFAGVFVAGMAAGYAMDGLPSRRPGPGPLQTVGSEIYAPLDLSAEQRTRIDAILREALPRTDTIMTSALERLRQQLDVVDAEVRQVLDDRQNRMLDSIRAESGDFAPGLRLRRPGPPR